MKSLLSVLSLVLMSSFAHATEFRCTIPSQEDWAAEINLSNRQAAFFDNDSWTVLNEVPNFHWNSTLDFVKFEGRDRSGITIAITMDQRTTWVPFFMISFTDSLQTLELPMSCREVTQLRSGI